MSADTALVAAINRLRKERNAVILAHYYQEPAIQDIADFIGDSLELSRQAASTDADVIVFCGVHFMAETAKILNPEKTVLNPNTNGGCSLAESVQAGDVVRLKQQYPDYTFVCYINTTAEVKAECDVCVTSSNVYKIIENLENDNVYFLPDRLMGENVKNYLDEKGIKKNFHASISRTNEILERFPENLLAPLWGIKKWKLPKGMKESMKKTISLVRKVDF